MSRFWGDAFVVRHGDGNLFVYYACSSPYEGYVSYRRRLMYGGKESDEMEEMAFDVFAGFNELSNDDNLEEHDAVTGTGLADPDVARSSHAELLRKGMAYATLDEYLATGTIPKPDVFRRAMLGRPFKGRRVC